MIFPHLVNFSKWFVKFRTAKNTVKAQETNQNDIDMLVVDNDLFLADISQRNVVKGLSCTDQIGDEATFAIENQKYVNKIVLFWSFLFNLKANVPNVIPG